MKQQLIESKIPEIFYLPRNTFDTIEGEMFKYRAISD